jgi:hypothetical protein
MEPVILEYVPVDKFGGAPGDDGRQPVILALIGFGVLVNVQQAAAVERAGSTASYGPHPRGDGLSYTVDHLQIVNLGIAVEFPFLIPMEDPAVRCPEDF